MSGSSPKDSASRSVREEYVAYNPDPDNPLNYIPRISVSTTKASGKVEKTFRLFEASDMERVLDYDNVEEAPPDGSLMVGEDDGNGGLVFPTRHCALRGNFVFFFDTEDVDDKSGPYASYHAPPLGVIPLDNVEMEFPPGGRRVFREHAHTDARNGYEFVVYHDPPELADTGAGDEDPTEKKEVEGGDAAGGEGGEGGGEGEEPAGPPRPQARPPVFLVALTLGERQLWADAINSRSKKVGQPTMLRASYSTSRGKEKAGVASVRQDAQDRRKAKQAGEKGKDSTMFDAEGGSEISQAVNEFGIHNFSEVKWMDTFFENHQYYDAPDKCDQMEHWQANIKKKLKAAVLEQYEYFVQASGEMTTMGREVSSLKSLVQTEMESIREMKEVVFSTALLQYGKDEMEMLEENDKQSTKKAGLSGMFDDDLESEMSMNDFSARGDRFMNGGGVGAPEEHSDDPAHAIEVPAWLEDVGEEVGAFVKECRYTDAIDLWTKAKSEVAELFEKHERPIQLWLSPKQQTDLKALQKTLDRLSDQMGHRLEESLRRKNEALKQASKRERSDPRASMAPIVSPCCLDDDAVPLQLLVKLGKTQQAANSFAARRSLLLLESLHEHPISGAGNVDLVIYSAQLSQSFFSCLASAVEGFLDLFLAAAPNPHGKDEASIGSSLHSSAASKNIPAGAVASVVLWCDGELSKFASAFGGARILANLALSPPPRNSAKQPRVVDGHLESNGNRERQNAIEVAAQCVDQAFSCAAQNLDSVGLPLTPRLAEYIRSRLKGCEGEVAALLSDRWSHVTLDWHRSQSEETNGEMNGDYMH